MLQCPVQVEGWSAVQASKYFYHKIVKCLKYARMPQHIVSVAIILVLGQLSVVTRLDCSYYCTVLQYFHYFILYAAVYYYITLALCGLSGHLLVQTMPWCPGYRDSLVHFIICIILYMFVLCHQIN